MNAYHFNTSNLPSFLLIPWDGSNPTYYTKSVRQQSDYKEWKAYYYWTVDISQYMNITTFMVTTDESRIYSSRI